MSATRHQPRKAMSPRATALAKIHIGATALGMIKPGDDETYRVMLRQVADVRSSKDLDDAGVEKVLAHLRTSGWRDTGRAPAPGAGGRRAAPGAARYERGTPAALIRWLWTQLHKAGLVDDVGDRALRRYCGQHAGLDPVADERDPRHLDRQQASVVIEQLKRWLHRKPQTAE